MNNPIHSGAQHRTINPFLHLFYSSDILSNWIYTLDHYLPFYLSRNFIYVHVYRLRVVDDRRGNLHPCLYPLIGTYQYTFILLCLWMQQYWWDFSLWIHVIYCSRSMKSRTWTTRGKFTTKCFIDMPHSILEKPRNGQEEIMRAAGTGKWLRIYCTDGGPHEHTPVVCTFITRGSYMDERRNLL